MIDLLTTPVGFAEQILGIKLYKWQDDVLHPLEMSTGHPRKEMYHGKEYDCPRRINIALATPNGAGKDSVIITAATHWWLAMHRRGKVAITSKSDLQLTNQTIPNVERYKSKFEGYRSIRSPRYELETKTGGRCIAFVTNNAERVEGWHKEDDTDGPLLLIVNEAKSVDEEIFQGLDRWTPNAVLMVSSTGIKRGRFYDAFTKLRASWICIKAGLLDCPHIPQERIDYIRETYGEDHPVTRSTLYAEFMDQDEIEKYICSIGALEFCIQNPPQHRPGMKVVFCDFADGGAENTIAYRDGNKITLEGCWRESNKFASVTRFIQVFKKLGVNANQIWGDAADKEMCDLLAEAGWKIHRQNFGAPANNNDIYLSWGAEAWREFALGVEKCEWILPNDPETIAQLTTRQRTFGRAGKLGAEEKFAMRKRNLPSPDRADAIVGAGAVRDYAQIQKSEISSMFDWKNEQESSDAGRFLAGIGAEAGYG